MYLTPSCVSHAPGEVLSPQFEHHNHDLLCVQPPCPCLQLPEQRGKHYLSIGDSVTCFSICISDFSAWRHKLYKASWNPECLWADWPEGPMRNSGNCAFLYSTVILLWGVNTISPSQRMFPSACLHCGPKQPAISINLVFIFNRTWFSFKDQKNFRPVTQELEITSYHFSSPPYSALLAGIKLQGVTQTDPWKSSYNQCQLGSTTVPESVHPHTSWICRCHTALWEIPNIRVWSTWCF